MTTLKEQAHTEDLESDLEDAIYEIKDMAEGLSPYVEHDDLGHTHSLLRELGNGVDEALNLIHDIRRLTEKEDS